MIKNERQYKITKAQVERFQQALRQIKNGDASRKKIHPLIRRAEEAAIQSQISELQEQLKEYQALQSGSTRVMEINSLEDLPRLLIRARIAAGMSHRDLAQRLGLKEQQIQRYEATDYRSASFRRIVEIAHALDIKIGEEANLPQETISWRNLIKSLSDLGIDKRFLTRRILPPNVTPNMEREKKPRPLDAELAMAISIIAKVFGWQPRVVAKGEQLRIGLNYELVPQFKLPSVRSEPRLAAYIVYAHYLALLTLEATKGLEQKTIPDDPARFKRDVLSAYGELNLKTCLEFVWDLGIPVLPLNDPGAFHAACWRVAGRNIIVLKQRTRSEARWLFDLLHETKHASSNPKASTQAILDINADTVEPADGDEESEAMDFAGNIVLNGRAEELAEKCVAAAQNKIEYLKAVVPKVAVRENVGTDSLANYLAFRLSMQGINWWGTAMRLQNASDPPPWETARDLFMQKVSLDALNDVDRMLLLRALTGEEDPTGA